MRARAAVGGILLVAGCTSGSPSTGHQPSPVPADRERAALAATRALWRTTTTVSPVFHDDGADAVAVAGDITPNGTGSTHGSSASAGPVQPQVVVYNWTGDSWSRRARVLLDIGGAVADVGEPAVPIRPVHVTPAPVPDLLVTVHYNAGPASAVVSKVTGSWQTVTFVGGLSTAGDERLNVHVGSGGRLTSTENDCVPDCAQGHPVVTSYHYDRRGGRFVGEVQTKR
jgi:hypothetical protein